MTSTRTVAAVDLGATSGRVMLGHVGPDLLEAEAVARFPNTPVRTRDGLHWSLTSLYGAITAGLRDAVRQSPGLASIGIDSWAVDYALLRDGTMLGEPYHYRDERTGRGVDAVSGMYRHPSLYSRNGLQFLPFNTVYQLAAEDPDILAFADSALLIPDLVAYWLTGAIRAERTNASTTGLVRIDDGSWDDELIGALGLPRRLFPAFVSPGEVIGELTQDIRADLGLDNAVPVHAVGSHDTASAVVAVPMQADAAAYISCGTWGLVGVEVEHPVLTDEAREAGFTNEGGVDGRVRLLHNVMGLWILTETLRGWERGGQTADLGALLAAAAELPENPVFDVNDPSFLPPGDMPARIDAWFAARGIRGPSTPAGYVRCIVESLAEAFADAALTAGRIGGVPVRTIHIVGGGALNELLCQRTADRAGMPVLAGPVEATALGNILVQARAVGLIEGTLEDLRYRVVRTHPPRRYDPQPAGIR